MNIKIIFLPVLVLILITTISAEDSIGRRQDAQTGVPYIISQPCATCSYINITVLTKDGIVLENVPMQNNGTTWVYNFTPNSSLRHDVNGKGDKDGMADSFAFWFDSTLSGERDNTSIIISDIVLLFVMIGLLLIVYYRYSKTDFDGWNEKIILEHKNIGNTMVKGFLYSLFKGVFVWIYFIGWIMILILQDVVYRFNSAEVYNYFTIVSQVYSLGLLLVLVFMIGNFISYMREVVNTLSENNWGVGDEK